MAKKTVVNLVDDIDGSVADKSFAFTWDNSAFEIDLNKKNSREFEKVLAPYVAAARVVPRRPLKRAAKPVTRSDSTADFFAVRDWAAKNNQPVAARGRIAGSVLDAFHAATTTVTAAATTVGDAVTASSEEPVRKGRRAKAAVRAPAARKSAASKTAASLEAPVTAAARRARTKAVQAPAATKSATTAEKGTLEAPTGS